MSDTRNTDLGALLRSVREDLCAYDPVDLLSASAALQIMPENADHILRLEALSHVAASLEPEEGKPRIGLRRLRTVCNSPPLGAAQIVFREDPFEQPFTEEVPFYGGSYVVFPGIVLDSAFCLRRLARAIFSLSAPSLDPSFTSGAHDCIATVLVLSNQIATRAGIGRGAQPGPFSAGQLVVPPRQMFMKLKAAVKFSKAEVSALLAERNIGLGALDQLATKLGHVPLGNYTFSSGDVLFRPLVDCNAHYVVAIPGMLVQAAINHVVGLAQRSDQVHALVERLLRSMWGIAADALSLLDNDPVGPAPPWEDRPPYACDSLFRLDTDKVTHALLVCDDLEDYDPTVMGFWDCKEVERVVGHRLIAVEERLFGLPRPPNEVLHLILSQGLGRAFCFALPSAAHLVGRAQALTVADLATLSRIEMGNPLAIWKFAEASDTIRKRCAIRSCNTLDEYQLYKASGHSYYMTDDGNADLLTIHPGTGLQLRLDATAKLDLHAAPYHQSGTFVEVVRALGKDRAPLYMPTSSLHTDKPEFLLEGYRLPIWITDGTAGRCPQGLLVDFAAALGYWLTELRGAVGPVVEALVDAGVCCLLIRLDLPSTRKWRDPGGCVSEDMAVRVASELESDTGTITLTVSEQFGPLLWGPDNKGERALLRRLLRGIGGLSQAARRELSDEAIERTLDYRAPLGAKMTLLSLSPAISPDADPAGLQGFREVQEADVSVLLDEVGDWLRVVRDLREGPIADQERCAVLNDVVVFLYTSLTKTVRTLRPDGLLEWLIRQQEEITCARASSSLLLPTRLACFASEAEMIEEEEKSTHDIAKASLANKFLIELVGARSPTGLRPISLSLYDRLLATADLVIDFGGESDLIHFGLADIKLKMLASGRLGAAREEYQQAQSAFRRAVASEDVLGAVRGFDRHWHRPGGNSGAQEEEPDFKQRLNCAANAEFGHSLNELIELMGTAVALGRDIDSVVAHLPHGELVSELATRLEWPTPKVTDALELLSLGPRQDFLSPPEPFRKDDVWPWRFNRELSHIRRPFLKQCDGQRVEVYWGPRHTYTACRNLFWLCAHGRLVARTPEMRAFLAGVHHEDGEAFNDRVANILEQSRSLVVRRRVKKVGRLRGKHGPPGDIDVLVVEPAKKRVEVLECKAFARARMPHEMANEYRMLLEGTKHRKSGMEKHRKRAEWVSEHLVEVLQWLGIKKEGEWRVRALVVVGQALFTPLLKGAPIPVLTLRDLAHSYGCPMDE